MPRFVLIDHSIKNVGGHNFEYALHVLKEAQSVGYEPVIVVNRAFAAAQKLPADWQIIQGYNNTAYDVPYWQQRRKRFDPAGEFRDAELDKPKLGLFDKNQASQKQSQPFNLLNTFSRPVRYFLWNKYNKRIKKFRADFIADTTSLYQQLGLKPSDQVFFSTVDLTELELLSQFFHQQPAAAKIDCHMQFHHCLFKGREPEYQHQLEKFTTVRENLQRIAAIPGQRVHCYTTNQLLAEQFNQLGSLTFRELPWSVNPQMGASRPPRNPERPLRVGISGGLRAEKGADQFARLADSLEHEFCRDRSAQFLLQVKRLNKVAPSLRHIASFHQKPDEAEHSTSPVAAVRWPLSTDDYMRLVRMTDIGLLLYDTKEYYARTSGVLVEMLNAGIPAIVPAGCWLGDQVSAANWDHAEKILQTVPALGKFTSSQIEWQDQIGYESWPNVSQPRLFKHNVKHDHDQITFGTAGQRRQTATMTAPQHATHLAIQFNWTAPQPCGVFLDIHVEARNRFGLTTQRWHEITGCRAAYQNTNQQATLIPLLPETTAVELTLSNAFGDSLIELTGFECSFLDAFATPHGCPLGAVGLIAADPSMAPALVREMIKHYDHYRVSAERHAVTYRELHSPRTVVQTIQSQAKQNLQTKPRRRAG